MLLNPKKWGFRAWREDCLSLNIKFAVFTSFLYKEETGWERRKETDQGFRTRRYDSQRGDEEGHSREYGFLSNGLR